MIEINASGFYNNNIQNASGACAVATLGGQMYDSAPCEMMRSASCRVKNRPQRQM